jgi:hypothetical protein
VSVGWSDGAGNNSLPVGRLARAALEAEILLRRRRLRRAGIQVILFAVAAWFALTVIVVTNLGIWIWLRLHNWPMQVALILCALNLVIAGIVAALAMRSPLGAVELEAKLVRDQALAGIRHPVNWLGGFVPAVRLIDVARRTR